MPGLETNENIMTGLNQLIKSVNDLALVLFDPTNPTNVLELIEFVGDNVDALSTMLEARSIAGVTAQNANFNDLITAINALTLTCSPTVNNNITVPDYPPTGVYIPEANPPIPPSDPITDPANLPTDEQFPTKSYDIKCRASNAMVENLRSIWQWAYDKDIDDIANAVGENGVAIIVGIVAGAVGVLLSVGTLGYGALLVGAAAASISGFITNIAAAVGWVGVDADRVLGIMDSDPESLVCALYTGQNYYESKQNFLNKLTSLGANANEINAFGLLLVPDLLNMLFGQRGPLFDYYADNVWAYLDGYSSPCPCDSCTDEDAGVYDFSLSSYNWFINYSISNYTPSYEAACCFKTVTSVPNVTPVICIDQTAPHDVGTITLDVEDYQSAIAAQVYVDVADTYGGTYTNVHSWTTGPNRDIVSAAINQTGKYVRVRLQCFASPWVKIHKITYS